MSIYANKIFLNIQGTPTRHNPMCLKHGHGYRAYVSVENAFINNLFMDISLWGGAINIFETKEGFRYSVFEIDCRDKEFLKSVTLKKLCKKHGIEVVVYDNEDDRQIYIDFLEQMRQ